MRHLLHDIYHITKKFAAGILLFLDYDGTLVPIAKRPEQATLPPATKKLLQRLSKTDRCKLAVISGRSLRDIRRLVGPKGIIYAGNHGLEISGPKIRFLPPLPAGYKAALKRIKKDISRFILPLKGVFIEDKGLTISVHCRLADRKGRVSLRAFFRKLAASYINDNIKIRNGKMVYEILPSIRWDKGQAVLWLLRRLAVGRYKKATVLYIGDDTTDEDAFRALRRTGVTIFVGAPRKSLAKYYLKGPDEVQDFLEKITEAR